MAARRTVVVCGLTFATLGAACAPSGSNTDTAVAASSTDSAGASVRQAVAGLNGQLGNLARTRNADSLAAWFAQDAMVLVNGVPVVRTRDSIRTFYDQFFQAMPIRDMTFSAEDVSVSGDVAVETGTSALSIAGPGQSAAVTVPGKYLTVWKRQPDGRWLVWRHAPSSNVMSTR
jgi:uncharacterized protein (TIGR02246 family)